MVTISDNGSSRFDPRSTIVLWRACRERGSAKWTDRESERATFFERGLQWRVIETEWLLFALCNVTAVVACICMRVAACRDNII